MAEALEIVENDGMMKEMTIELDNVSWRLEKERAKTHSLARRWKHPFTNLSNVFPDPFEPYHKYALR